MPRFASLAARSAALYSVLVGVAVLFAGWLIYTGNRDKVVEGRERDLEHRARTVHVRFDTEVRALANDVLFLANAPFLLRLADSWGDPDQSGELIADVRGAFAAMLKEKPSYAQARLLELSEEGPEIIRLDRQGADVVASPPEELQAKGHRDYFRKSLMLNAGEIYLSPINLNREFGEISLPHMPTLRAAAKVFDGEGRPFALVVINVDLRTLFSELGATAGEEASLYVANADGDYLVHPDAARTFGFDLGTRHRLESDFGDDVFESPENPGEIVRFIRAPLWERPDSELIIGVGTPRERVLSELAAIRNRSLAAAFGAAMLAAALVWILAFLLSRRLGQLADAIGRYQPGTGAPALPEKGRDEVAVVARKFTVLSEKIDEQVKTLETARKLADENRRAKEEFLAILSHEIRTPMNAVTGLLHTLATESPAEDRRSVIEALQYASRKLIAVVNDVLDFSKIEAGQVRFERAPFDLDELLVSVRTSHLPQAKEGGIELSCRKDADVPQVLCGDSLRLYQVLTNLVQNALKFTKPRGSVTIRVARLPVEGGKREGEEGIRLRFVVQDTGIGMSQDQLEKAMSRFGQVRTGVGQRFGGTGLGLPIARMLIEFQGGNFAAHSEPGVGSRFTFELEFERSPEGTTIAPSAVPSKPDLEGVRILCVEDVASNRQVVSSLLAPCRSVVDFATSAEEALDILEQSGEGGLPDLILLDLQLPDRDGASLATDLCGRWPEIPVVGLTAQTAGSLLERCRNAGVRTFLWKPIDAELFFRTVARAVNRGTDGAPAAPSGGGPGQGSGVASVLELFDGDTGRADKYLLTLAGELEEAAAALPGLVAGGDYEGLRESYHRLQNGLTLVGAGEVLQAIDHLSKLLSEDPAAAEEEVADCQNLLADTAANLREKTGAETVDSRR